MEKILENRQPYSTCEAPSTFILIDSDVSQRAEEIFSVWEMGAKIFHVNQVFN
jgi:hypothetical protein